MVRFNEDRLSGADSRFTTLAAQIGREGAAWSGGSFGWGNEAYSVLGLTPGEARFKSVVGTIFHRRWIRRHQGFMVQTEFEQKLDTYDRIGISALLFFEF